MWKSLMARIVFVSVSVIAFILLLFIAANQYAIEHMRNQAVRSQQSLLDLYSAQMDDSMETLRLSMIQRVNDDLDLNALCFYDPSDNAYLLSAQQCKKWLNQNLGLNGLISSQYIYDARSGMLLTASKRYASARHQYIQTHLSSFLLNTGYTGASDWTLQYTTGYLTDGAQSGWLLTKCIPLTPQVTLGACVSVSDFIPPLQDVISYEGTVTRIYSRNGLLLAQSSNDPPSTSACSDELYSALLQNDGQPYFIYKKADTGARYIVISHFLDTAGIRIVTLLPERAILQQLSQFRTIGELIPLLLVVIVCAFALSLPRLYRPYQQLVDIMEGVAQGDLTLRLPEGRTPEFRQVNAGFNKMVERIEQLNRDVYEQTLLTHKAELRHLQAQINPHFYQNTLNLIYNLAALKQYELIQKTALHLADYFRFIMRSGDQPIRLCDELRHIENYMELQKIRYPRAFEYLCQADESLLTFPILPLLIQPFVENSVIHGFTTRRVFCVTVRVFSTESGSLAVEIEDNGNGIPQELIAELNRLMSEPDQERGQHIGVWNVVTRLRHFYGKRAMLRFDSRLESGTCVHLEIPPCQQKEDAP